MKWPKLKEYFALMKVFKLMQKLAIRFHIETPCLYLLLGNVMNLQIDSTNIMRVFDKWTYLLILASVLTVTLVFLLLSYCQQSFTSPSILPETLLYVVSAFFQETYPVSKIPHGGMKVRQFNGMQVVSKLSQQLSVHYELFLNQFLRFLFLFIQGVRIKCQQ